MTSSPSLEAPCSSQYWLVNARSGNGEGSRLLAALEGMGGVSAHPISFSTLEEQISQAPAGATIVVAGGDGTFSAVLGEGRVVNHKVACIPIGTANDLARELGISALVRRRSWAETPQVISTLNESPFAVWTVSVDGRDYPCVNYVSIGYEGAVVNDFARWRTRSKISGKLTNRCAYTVFGLRHALHTLKGLRLESDTIPDIECRPTTGLILTNIKSHLGLGLSNGASSPADDVIECVSIPHVFGFISMMGASLGVLSPPSVLARGKDMRISGIPYGTPMQIDGEAREPIRHGQLRVSLRHFARVLCVTAPS